MMRFALLLFASPVLASTLATVECNGWTAGSDPVYTEANCEYGPNTGYASASASIGSLSLTAGDGPQPGLNMRSYASYDQVLDVLSTLTFTLTGSGGAIGGTPEFFFDIGPYEYRCWVDSIAPYTACGWSNPISMMLPPGNWTISLSAAISDQGYFNIAAHLDSVEPAVPEPGTFGLFVLVGLGALMASAARLARGR